MPDARNQLAALSRRTHRLSALVLAQCVALAALAGLVTVGRGAAGPGARWPLLVAVTAGCLCTLACTRRLLQAIEDSRRLMEFERLAATGSFASWVAHQVRNPLAVIRAQAQLLLAEPAPDAARIEASCTSIVEQAESVGNVFALIMSLVQPLHLERQVVELERVVAGTVAALAALEGGAITFELDGVFAPVIGHAGLLGEALKNLVANAVECLAPGPGVVRLEGRTEGQWVYLTVADNGPGIPPGVVERSFELGYTTKPHGTGLGLPIVRAIAEAHGGRVVMMSRHGGPGAGTRVTMVLPRAGTP